MNSKKYGTMGVMIGLGLVFACAAGISAAAPVPAAEGSAASPGAWTVMPPLHPILQVTTKPSISSLFIELHVWSVSIATLQGQNLTGASKIIISYRDSRVNGKGAAPQQIAEFPKNKYLITEVTPTSITFLIENELVSELGLHPIVYSMRVVTPNGETDSINYTFPDSSAPRSGTDLTYLVLSTLKTVAAALMSPSGGSYETSVSVTMSSKTTGAEIRYTLDGTRPSASSLLYTGPLTLSESKTVKSIALMVQNAHNLNDPRFPHMLDSAVNSRDFVITKADGEGGAGSSTADGGVSGEGGAGGSTTVEEDPGAGAGGDPGTTTAEQASTGGCSISQNAGPMGWPTLLLVVCGIALGRGRKKIAAGRVAACFTGARHGCHESTSNQYLTILMNDDLLSALEETDAENS